MDKKHLYITTFILVVGGLAATLMPGWFSKEPDVRFFLSDPIPLRFGGTENGAVQQLNITNKGTAAAIRIRIKLPPRIVDHQLDKAYESDETRVVTTKDSFEVIYSLLSSQDQFRLIVKTDGAAITRQELSIKHDSGTAIDALTPNRSFLTQFLGPLAVLILPAIIFGLTVLDIALTGWKWKAEGYDSWETVLKRPKPFWAPSSKWSQIRIAAITNCKVTNPSGTPLDQTKYYTILNNDKPSYINHVEWEALKTSVVDQLDKEIAQKCSGIFSAKDAEKILAVQRPALYPMERWTGFTQKLLSIFIKEKKRELNSALIRPSPEELRAMLDEPVPKGMSSALWANWIQEIRESYKNVIYNELSHDSNPLASLKRHDLSLLKIDQRDYLENFANTRALIKFHRSLAYSRTDEGSVQQKPEWMEESTFGFYKDFYTKAAKSERIFTSCTALIKNVKRITYDLDLDEADKDQIDPESWNDLVKIHSEIVESKRVIQSKEEELRETSVSTLADRSLILRQLAVLNRLLADPKSIFQVEDYDNPFASGNFDMLKALASKMIAMNNIAAGTQLMSVPPTNVPTTAAIEAATFAPKM